MISIVRIVSLDDYVLANNLVEAMAIWDAAETSKLGFSGEAVLREIYGYTPERLMETYSLPGTGFYLAYSDSRPAGCIAFAGAGDIGEVHKVFVRPEARGNGLGSRLLNTVLEDLRQLGCRQARLETVTFMTEAIALYQRLGFRFCPPFSPAPAGLDEITLYMERDL